MQPSANSADDAPEALPRIPREDDLAWDLVEQHRDLLSAEERISVFVGLGVGDFSEVIRRMLTVLSEKRKALSEQAAADVQAWISCYHTDVEFSVLLSRIQRLGA